MCIRDSFTLSVLSLSSCSKETLDYNHPDVDLFVKQLKAGKYSTQSPDGAGLPDLAFTLPVLIAQILIWVSVVLTLISGFQYVWAGRRYFAGGKTDEK